MGWFTIRTGLLGHILLKNVLINPIMKHPGKLNTQRERERKRRMLLNDTGHDFRHGILWNILSYERNKGKARKDTRPRSTGVSLEVGHLTLEV